MVGTVGRILGRVFGSRPAQGRASDASRRFHATLHSARDPFSPQSIDLAKNDRARARLWQRVAPHHAGTDAAGGKREIKRRKMVKDRKMKRTT
jgi:hypothetical protein